MNYKGVCIDNAHDVVEWCKTHFASNKCGAPSGICVCNFEIHAYVNLK